MSNSLDVPKWTRLASSVAWATVRGVLVNVPLAIGAAAIVTMPAVDLAALMSWNPLWPADVPAGDNARWIAMGVVLTLSVALDLAVLSQPINDDAKGYACRVGLVNALARIYTREDFRGDPAKKEWAAAVLWNAKMDNFAGAWFLGIVGLPALCAASIGPWWWAFAWFGLNGWAIWLVVAFKVLFILIVAVDIARLAWHRFEHAH